MALYKVSFEIDVDADCPLNAAKMVNDMMDNHLNEPDAIGWQFYVQQEDSENVFSVDLDEEDCDAVLPVEKYEPFIN